MAGKVDDLVSLIVERLTEKLGLLQRMTGITKSLLGIPYESNQERWTAVTAEREDLIKTIQELDADMAALEGEISDRLVRPPYQIEELKPHVEPDLYTDLERIRAGVRAVLAELEQMDKECQEVLAMENEAVKLQLHRLQGGQRLRRAYGRTKLPGSLVLNQIK